MVGVLKFAALSNGVPVETMSTHSLRAGGTATMLHAGYGLLEVKGWGRWESSRFHGYLWYDMQTMRHVGKRWLWRLGCWSLQKSNLRGVKLLHSEHPGRIRNLSLVYLGNITHSKDVSEELLQTIRKAVRLWRLVDNPHHG